VAARRSAGVLVFRRAQEPQAHLEVLLGHLGGPFWARKDQGAWTVPKGEHPPEEEPRDAARREFEEELGLPVPAGEWLDLGEVRQSGGKVVRVWAVEGDLDPGAVTPGTFETEWPPGSGRRATFPELDRVQWWDLAGARERLVAAQRELLDRLVRTVG
jgi:predicted NUDIX family NTP pyrophosphohydrolase